MLGNLQANILKGHGRAHTINLFLRFDPSRADQIKVFLRNLNATNALAQLRESLQFKRTGRSGGLVTLCMLSAEGYKALGVLAKAPNDPAFLAGLQARQQLLSDPPSQKWDKQYRRSIHAMIVLADASAPRVQTARYALLAKLPRGASLLGEEAGARLHSLLSPGEGIEHFGYVDGRSNPLMLEEDVDDEATSRGGTSVWNPRFGLGIVLVRDPGSAAASSFGSFVVFRKLEQNVKGFKLGEKALASALHLRGEDKERAGAMVIGRFEDGTPICLQSTAGLNRPVSNNFDYARDPSGAKCPLHSHMRKVNPRGESVTPDGASLQEERSHAIVRRGITYGTRRSHPNNKVLNISALPSQGVGLLFMAYQSNIENQFEFVQAKWANNPQHLGQRGVSKAHFSGIDPVIGSGLNGSRTTKAAQRWPEVWGRDASSSWKEFDFRGYVKMLGGEYFFAPSISTLRDL